MNNTIPVSPLELRSPPSHGVGWRALSVPFLLVWIVFAAPAWESLWTSDDYFHARDAIEGRPLDWEGAIRHGSGGNIGVTRVVNYPLVAAFPWFFGVKAAHGFAVAVHALNAMLVTALAFRLGLNRFCAMLAGSQFAVSLWAFQPVMWWAAVPCSIATALMLGAYLIFAGDRDQKTVMAWRVAVSSALAFLSLCFYEQWLAGWLGFVGLTLFGGTRKPANRRIAACFLLLIPFVLWLAARYFTYPDNYEVRAGQLSAGRLPVVFLSIHLRMAQWLTDTPWLSLFRQAFHLSHPWIWSVGLGLWAVLLLRSSPAAERTHPSAPAAGRFLLAAWLFFLAARLVYLAQGGIALDSRHSYGGAVAVAIGFSWLLSLGLRKCPKFVLPSILLILIVQAVAMRGQAVHYAALTSEEQRLFLEKAGARTANSPKPPLSLPSTKGEMGVYSEHNGGWLEFRLQNLKSPDSSR